MPPPNQIDWIEEPYVKVTVLTPTEYVGALMELCQQRRGEMAKMEYLSEERVELVYTMPARRDRHGLLRPAEVADARVRVASTTSRRATAAPTS